MKVVGLVTGLSPLPSIDGRPPLYRVSVEGLSFLADPAILENIAEGNLVSLTVAVHWKKGARPVHFVRACQRLDG